MLLFIDRTRHNRLEFEKYFRKQNGYYHIPILTKDINSLIFGAMKRCPDNVFPSNQRSKYNVKELVVLFNALNFQSVADWNGNFFCLQLKLGMTIQGVGIYSYIFIMIVSRSIEFWHLLVHH